MTTPSQAQTALTKFADRYRRCGELVASRLDDWCLPATASGDGRRSQGGHSDPTFNAAAAAADGGPHRDREIWRAGLTQLRYLGQSFGCASNQTPDQLARALAAIIGHTRVPGKILRRIERVCDDLDAIMARSSFVQPVAGRESVPACIVCERVQSPLRNGLCNACREAKARAFRSGRWLGDDGWVKARRASIERGELLADSPLSPHHKPSGVPAPSTQGKK